MIDPRAHAPKGTIHFCADCGKDITDEVADTGNHICFAKSMMPTREVKDKLFKVVGNKLKDKSNKEED
jgi:hypothetical protein